MTDLDSLLEPLVQAPGHEPPPVSELRSRLRSRARRRHAGLAVALVVAVAAPMLALAGRGSGDDLQVRNPAANDPSGPVTTAAVPPAPLQAELTGMPTGYDPSTAAAVFVADGTAEEVASAYLADRLPDLDARVVPADYDPRAADPDAELAVVGWQAPADANGYSGHVVLRDRTAWITGQATGGERWAVVGARTDGIDASATGIVNGTAAGTVRSSHIDLLAVDVMGEDGTPVPGSPDPDGPPGSGGGPWGTAGTSSEGQVTFEVPIDGPVVLRVRLVGGTFLAITEAALFTPAPAPGTEVDPPWAADALPASAAPATVSAWQSEGSPGASCPAVAPGDVGEGAGATPRATTRGQPDAWWVAYDLPGAPGEAEIQSPSADAGKETFSVSAIVSPSTLDHADRFPNKVRWSDGSHGSYGPSGDGELLLPAGVPQPWLAYLAIGDSPCLYQVHTYLGRDHLEHLIDQLRYVQGAP